MKKTISITTTLVFSALPFFTSAQENAETLLSDGMCYACHQLQDASIGPSWQAIAARHGNRKDLMTDVLANKIINGGGGNWGLVPMVPNQRVNEADAKQMAQWILDQSSQ